MNPKLITDDTTPPGRASGFFRSFLTRGAPPVVRLRSAVADFTLDDRIDDPFLDALLDELASEEGVDLALLHARAWLLRTRSLPGRASRPTADWGSALAQLANEPTPNARVLVDPRHHFVLPDAQYARAEGLDCDDLASMPACAPLLVDRASSLWSIGDDLLAANERAAEPSQASRDVARWEEDFFRWTKRARAGALEAHDGPTRLARSLADDVLLAPGDCPWGTPWTDLDRLLGAVWLALRRAAASSEHVTLANGEHLVPVGAGVCLSIDARHHARRDESRDIRAAFRTTLGAAGGFSPVTRHISATGARGDASDPGWELPVEVYVTGLGLAVSIRFVFVPWLADGASVDLMRLATLAGRRGGEGGER